jgi:hypothetical protein
MKPQFNPAWLVSLLCRWSARSSASEFGALGYPKKACGFSERTTGGYSHTNPVAFSAEDFKDLEVALKALEEKHNGQLMAVLMHYKPWVVAQAREDGWPFGNSTYFQRLHAAHSFLATKLDSMKKPVDAPKNVE